MSQYINNVKDGKLSLHAVNSIMQYISKHLVVSEISEDILNSGNKITYNLTSLLIYLLKGHKS